MKRLQNQAEISRSPRGHDGKRLKKVDFLKTHTSVKDDFTITACLSGKQRVNVVCKSR